MSLTHFYHYHFDLELLWSDYFTYFNNLYSWNGNLIEIWLVNRSSVIRYTRSNNIPIRFKVLKWFVLSLMILMLGCLFHAKLSFFCKNCVIYIDLPARILAAAISLAIWMVTMRWQNTGLLVDLAKHIIEEGIFKSNYI